MTTEYVEGNVVKGNGFEYTLEKRLVKKLDLMIDRITQENPKLDAVLANEGGEGLGKSNSSVAEAYYVKVKTKREAHLFFRLKPLIEFAKKTKNKIIIWDEPSLDSLTADRMKEINRDLTKLMMTCRKKRHFFIFNWVKFWKFDEYLQVDRCLAIIHMYARKQIEYGRFFYIPKKYLESLRNDFLQRKQRNYLKYRLFGGKFPDIMQQHFDKMGFFVEGIPNATYEVYEREKDRAINSIGEKEEDKGLKEIKLERELRNLKYLISKVDIKNTNTKEELARQLKISVRNLQKWAYLPYTDPLSLGKSSFEGDDGSDNKNNLDFSQDNEEKDSAEE